MVWFQCEDCGENLKKPKLANHFRICSAFKLSCIDCGEMFGQQAVQGHTQCITEAEKYGPKGQGKASSNNNTPAKTNDKDSKQQPDFDIRVGLSERPPWICSICNTKATSEQTLLLHAEGKKHRAKARAFHASKQAPKQGGESKPNSVLPSTEGEKKETDGNEGVDEAKTTERQNDHNPYSVEVAENVINKKRKHDESENGIPDANGNCDREVILAGKSDSDVKKVKKGTTTTEDTLQKIKWKKFIKSSLKTSPDGAMKIKKLKTLVLKVMKESGIADAEIQLGDTLEHKINSSKRFIMDGKYVRLAPKA
ncbi:hypothetical protein MLD38_014266 [Melastoma candidum]|uniref:Uncharacterized protein n=1 Tax=Melastoma candidum TaxID=119954 RepID=A0ACB9RCB6_9MYRT|nr:hypothetical protein MLD38_014266 [Melastoma candidum]